jgi:anti-sigma regulatory factor (Ser/Thr protein kinase)/putative methionine-R-sulfoxide reductase with GAF domain
MTRRASGGTPDQRLLDLQSVTDAALAYLPLEDLLNALLERAAAILNADTAAILLLDEEGDELVARAAKGLEEEVRRGTRIPVGRGFAGRIAATRAPVAIDDLDRFEVVNPLLREKGLRSLLGVPLLVEGSVLGVLHVGTLRSRHFTEEDIGLLQAVGDRAALAIGARLAEQERGLATALQASLFPSPLPELPGLRFSARYLPAASEAVGGDWYDVFELAGGTIGVAIGDVVGKGFKAAALMGQLRAGLRAYALDRRPPAEVVRRLNRLLRQIDPGHSATAMYLVLDPGSGDGQLVSAGHPPPVELTPGGEVRLIRPPRSVPLGTIADPDYEAIPVHLRPGSSVLLYTDGLVEDPAESLDAGLRRLQDTLGRVGEGDDMCGALTDAMLPEGAVADDVAAVSVTGMALDDPLEFRMRANLESAPLLRRVVRRWLRDRGASENEVDTITLACSEACANAIEHAYAPGANHFVVGLWTEGREVTVKVSDEGAWRPPRGRNRGRGLVLIEGMMQRLHIDRSSDGTAVTMTTSLQGDV